MIKKQVLLFLLIIVTASVSVFGCKDSDDNIKPSMIININEFVHESSFDVAGKKSDDYEYSNELNIIDDNYRNYYEIFVRSFNDSDDDGIGDLNGVTQKLDYLEELGVTGIWLMPINPSKTYHKYDVDDYYEIDSSYGTMNDLENLLEEAEKRDINIIMDLVINHSSTSNYWFSQAYNAVVNGDLDNKYIEYYNIKKGSSSTYYRIGSTDYYYEAYFWDQMPDLNMDCESLREEIKDIAKFWLEKGVSGFRVDAAMHIYGQANDDKNIEFWTWFVDYCKTVKEDVFVVGEIWSNSEKISKYYQSDMSVFNYYLGGPSLGTSGSYIRAAIIENEAKSIVKSITDWQRKLKGINQDAIDSNFLTNHDNARSAGQLRKNIYAIKLAAALYLMAPGASYTYYGEEIGMMGSGKDENFRAPMYWSYNEESITDPPPNMDEVKHFFPAVDVQTQYTNLIYSTYKRAFGLRNENPEIARGNTELINIGEDFGAYTSTYNDSTVIIIHNITTKPQTVKLSKSKIGYSEIRGYLNPTGEKFFIQGEEFTFPAYATLILK